MMRTAIIGAAVLCFALLIGVLAVPKEDRTVHPFVDSDATVAEKVWAETVLFQEDVSNPARAFPECGFKGQARSEGTPVVIRGHNDVMSLKGPSGQCATLFSKDGFNKGIAEGQMLEVRGPLNVACLAAFKFKDSNLRWGGNVGSYKMGPCKPQSSEEMATKAIDTAAEAVPDVSALSDAAVKAAKGQYGSLVMSRTRLNPHDGVLKPYDSETIHDTAAQTMDLAGTSDPVEEDSTEAAYPYADHTQAQEVAQMEHDHPANKTEAKEVVTGMDDVDAIAAQNLTEFKYEHAHLGEKAYEQFHADGMETPEDEKLAAQKEANKPFAKENQAIDDLEDLPGVREKNSVGCDPMLGCKEPAGPCVDKDSHGLCDDYVASGSCNFDYVARDCQKSCDLCPVNQGSVADDAYLGEAGHYYLGQARRRVGSGFGRRRRSPKEEEAPEGEAAVVQHTVTTKVATDILHPDGVETHVEAGPSVDCKACVAKFVDSATFGGDTNGCKIWKEGGDPTVLADSLLGKECRTCADQAAAACGVLSDPVSDAIANPVSNPSAVAAAAKDAADKGSADLSDAVPAAVKQTLDVMANTAGMSVSDEQFNAMSATQKQQYADTVHEAASKQHAINEQRRAQGADIPAGATEDESSAIYAEHVASNAGTVAAGGDPSMTQSELNDARRAKGAPVPAGASKAESDAIYAKFMANITNPAPAPPPTPPPTDAAVSPGAEQAADTAAANAETAAAHAVGRAEEEEEVAAAKANDASAAIAAAANAVGTDDEESTAAISENAVSASHAAQAQVVAEEASAGNATETADTAQEAATTEQSAVAAAEANATAAAPPPAPLPPTEEEKIATEAHDYAAATLAANEAAAGDSSTAAVDAVVPEN
jgi:hypothetical protein